MSENGVLINFSLKNNLLLTLVEGLSENEIILSESQSTNQVGSTIQERSVSAKNITINGVIRGVAAPLKKLLIDTILPDSTGTLIYNNKLKINVTPVLTPSTSNKPTDADFQIILRAPFPYWQAINSKTEYIAGLEPMFSFPINYSNTNLEDPTKHMFGRKIKTFFKEIKNEGNVPTTFQVFFIAKTPLSNPKITKVTKKSVSEFIRLEVEMKTGDVIMVDTTVQPMQILQLIGNKSINVFNYLDIDSTLFRLDTNSTLIRYDADTGRDGLDCYIVYNPTYSGTYGDDNTYE